MNAPALVDADAAPAISSTSHNDQWVPFVAGVFTSVLRSRTYTSAHVLKMRNRIQVIGSDAAARSAQVVQFAVIGNGTNNQLVDHSMRSQPASLVVVIAITPDDAVAIGSESSGPQPTTIGLRHLAPYSFGQRHTLRSRHGYMVPMDGK